MSCLHIIRWWSTFSLHFRATVFFRAATGVAAAPPLDLWSLLRANGESGEREQIPICDGGLGKGRLKKQQLQSPSTVAAAIHIDLGITTVSSYFTLPIGEGMGWDF